jgi:very-short-patch-repair endonuclease
LSNGCRRCADRGVGLIERLLVVEVTGRLGHVSDAERTRDAQRRNELQDLGFTVIEYTSIQIWEQPAEVRQNLRRRLH